MVYTHKNKGTCSSSVTVVTDGDIIKSVSFTGGCSGNTQGVARLAEGQRIDDVIATIKGIRCGFKSTSCPDQLALALEEIKSAEGL